jgi:uncharacterized protein (TIGR03083 family)
MRAQQWSFEQEACRAAAEWFVDTAAAAEGRWDSPGLGEWTVRDLMGHTTRALVTVTAYLDSPARPVELPSPEAYYSAALARTDPAAVAQRGRDAGAALGEDPAAAVRAAAGPAAALVRRATGDETASTPAGRIRLQDYLPTRTFELTVHTLDLCAALGLVPQVPPAPARSALGVVGALATAGGGAAPLLRAVTGRGPLPDGFTVL